ncbi:MAG: lysophospholipid acyltransferase family protein [candidate division KSB1 bacterium]|nr:lysophospholipid acyltransferase family protein [candidate division KSB1 bacterium]
MATTRDRIELILARGVAVAFGALPLRMSAKIGEWLGLLLFDVVRLRRRVAEENLRAAFPELSRRQVTQLARRTYRNFGITLAEFGKLPRLGREEIAQRVHLANGEVLAEVRRLGRGAILVGGHFGNWEWMAAGIQAAGYNLYPIAASQRNPLVDRLIDEVRLRAGLRVVKTGAASVRQILQILRRGEFVGILFDQDAGQNGEFVEFLGRPASTARGPAVFHLKTGAPIVLGIPERVTPGRHRVHLHLFDFSALPGTEEEKIHHVTQAISSRLEEAIRRHPEQWFWMHRRWKTAPKTV